MEEKYVALIGLAVIAALILMSRRWFWVLGFGILALGLFAGLVIHLVNLQLLLALVFLFGAITASAITLNIYSK